MNKKKRRMVVQREREGEREGSKEHAIKNGDGDGECRVRQGLLVQTKWEWGCEMERNYPGLIMLEHTE